MEHEYKAAICTLRVRYLSWATFLPKCCQRLPKSCASVVASSPLRSWCPAGCWCDPTDWRRTSAGPGESGGVGNSAEYRRNFATETSSRSVETRNAEAGPAMEQNIRHWKRPLQPRRTVLTAAEVHRLLEPYCPSRPQLTTSSGIEPLTIRFQSKFFYS